MGAWLALLWLLEALDVLAPSLHLDAWGISPRIPAELPQIFTAPLIHYGFAHLLANSAPFMILGMLALTTGWSAFVVSTVGSVAVSGLLVWLVAPTGTVTAGASGLIFGWFTFLLAYGFWSRRWVPLFIAAGTLIVYGGMLWGVLPSGSGVSWQAHLGGAAGGLVAARLVTRSKGSTRTTA